LGVGFGVGLGVGFGVGVGLGVGLGEGFGVGLGVGVGEGFGVGEDGSAENAARYSCILLWNSAFPILSLNVELKEMGSLVVQVNELLRGVTIRGLE